ncbi:MAG: TetR/AcrR family transcriptional regulator [Phycisphaerae bacterium]
MAEAVHDRKHQLRATAERLFAQRGFHATSVRDIANALNIKGGSLYTHMDSKDDLLWDIVTAAADSFFAAVRPIIDADLLTIEKLRRMILAHVRVITSDLDAAAVYSNEWRNLTDNRREDFAQRRHEYERMLRDLVRRGIEEGTLADVDEKFATLLILSSMNWIYQWYRPDGPMTPEEIARKLTELLLNGLRRGGT